MTAPTPMMCLQARAQARAILFGAGDFATYEEAIEPLVAYAEDAGLIALIGAAPVHAIIANAFAPHVE